MLKRTLLFTTSLFLLATPAMAQEALNERITRLEQELAALKEQVAAAQATQAATAQATQAASVSHAPDISFGKSGVKFASPDGDFTLRLRGYAHFDNRTFFGDTADNGTNEFLARRIRPIIEGTVSHDFAYRIMYDFGGDDPRLFDAYGEYKPSDAFNLRVGKFKTPVGLERLLSVNDITFAEVGLPSNLVPNRDIGVMAYGNIIPQLSYEIGVFNGAEDLGNRNGDEDDNKELAARLFAHPFVKSDSVLKGLGLGIAGTWGEKDGSLTARQVGDYRTASQARFFRYAGATFADGEHWRLAPQGYFYSGPFGLLAEYTVSHQELTNGANHAVIVNTAWEAQLSYMLTGEDNTHSNWPKIARPFDPAHGGWGAWEIGVKYGRLEIDGDAFPLFADLAVSANKARNAGLVLNGYLNDNIRVSLDYEYTDFDGGATGGDRQDEQVLLSRIGFKF